MKKYTYTLLTIISVFFIIFNSCQYFTQLSYEEWEETSTGVNDPDIYVGGSVIEGLNNYPCYWKNRNITILLPDSLTNNPQTVQSICIDGDDIYCGGAYDNNGIMNACYWKNNKLIKVELDNPSTSPSIIQSITESRGIVYACGEENVDACYWVNKKKYPLDNPNATSYQSYSISVDNDSLDFFIAGYLGTGPSYACYWKNGEAPVILGEGMSYGGILSNGTFYTSCFTANTPGFWKNNHRFDLPQEPVNIEVHDITIYKGDVYLAGYETSGNAVIWKNKSRYWTSDNTLLVQSIAIFNDDFYVCGNDGSVAYYYKNNIRHALPVPAGYTNSYAFDIAVK